MNIQCLTAAFTITGKEITDPPGCVIFERSWPKAEEKFDLVRIAPPGQTQPFYVSAKEFRRMVRALDLDQE